MMLLPYLCQQQICPPNASYIPHAQITQCALKKEIWQYIGNSLVLTMCQEVLYREDNDANTNNDNNVAQLQFAELVLAKAAKNSGLNSSLQTPKHTQR